MSDKTEVMERAPQGTKMEGYYGPGNLRPGVGKLVQRSGQPQYCGAMIGRAFGYTQHPNKLDKNKISTRFVGQFINIDYAGVTHNVYEQYLPSVIERTVKAVLDLQEGTAQKNPVPFAVEVWCDPDENPSNQLGFRYAVYDRVQKNENDPLLALAYETGLISRPALPPASNEALIENEEVNPETGEITSKSSRKRAA